LLAKRSQQIQRNGDPISNQTGQQARRSGKGLFSRSGILLSLDGLSKAGGKSGYLCGAGKIEAKPRLLKPRLGFFDG
jgi:hypothetical protein